MKIDTIARELLADVEEFHEAKGRGEVCLLVSDTVELVAARIRQAIELAVIEERRRCERIASTADSWSKHGWEVRHWEIAEAIRKQ